MIFAERSILIHAWNELAIGGYIVPTVNPNDRSGPDVRRIAQVRVVLCNSRCEPADMEAPTVANVR